jgi:protein O-GlcNAc transferase
MKKIDTNFSKPSQQQLNSLLKYYQAGRYSDVEKLSISITKEFPEHPFAWKVLAVVLNQNGKISEALVACQKSTQLEPGDSGAHNNLGNTLKLLGRLVEAEASYRQAIALKPDYADAHYNLGITLKELGKLEKAEESYRQAIALKPNYAKAHNNLGVTFQELGKLEKAEASYRQAIALKPDYADAHYNLGITLKELGKLEKAEESYRQAIALKPNYAKAHNNLGNLLKQPGRFDEALASFNKAIEIDVNYSNAYSNKNLCLNYSSLWPSLFIYKQHLEFEKQFGRLKTESSLNLLFKKDLTERLRIGYVSADFRKHSVAFFFEPLLQNHNSNVVETFCYYNNTVVDTTTKRLMATCDNWRSIFGITNQDVINLIRNDKIDILVDLSGHTAGNSLLVFAQKPSPIQVTWLGYPNTTGLSAIDYRFTDIIADPIGEADELHSETLLRLPNGFQCYKGNEKILVDIELPQISREQITFGSFNNVSKLTPEVIKIWSKILHAIPTSRLILKFPKLNSNTAYYHDLFMREGIVKERIEFYQRSHNMEDHLGVYKVIDIALDPFPYNGATTTCEALWMGVPVITLLGDRHVGRVGASILTNVGLTDFIAHDINHYIQLGVEMSANTNYLKEIRAGLRKRMQSAPICNPISFASDVEAAYQDMWHKYKLKVINN